MIVKFSFFKTDIELDNDKLFTIILEERQLYNCFLQYLNYDFHGEDKFIIVHEKNEELDASEICFFIPNVFMLDINSKRNISYLYKDIKSLYFEDLNKNIEVINEDISKTLNEVSLDYSFEIFLNKNLIIDDILKLVDLRFKDDYENKLEYFIKFIEISIKSLHKRIFIVNHLHEYFDEDEISCLLQELKYYNIYIVDIEYRMYFEPLKNEDIRFVDTDLCSLE